MGNHYSKNTFPKVSRKFTKKYKSKIHKSDVLLTGKALQEPQRTSTLCDKCSKCSRSSRRNTYLLPVDEDEEDRMINDHYVHRMTWGRNFMAPVEDILIEGGRVLDVGCGSGTWMFEVATEFPESMFVGIDILPLVPMIRPPNVMFQQANFLEKLAFDDETFDFVHVRGISLGMTQGDWQPVIDELVRVTKVGGYIELGERNTEWIGEGPLAARMRLRATQCVLARTGIDLIPTPHISRTLNSHICLDQVFHEARRERLGGWGGKVGELHLQRLCWIIKNIKTTLLKVMNIPSDQFDRDLETVINEVQERKVYEMSHRYWSRRVK